MTALTRGKIFAKLENLQEYLEYLEQLRSESVNESVFITDFHLFGAVERYLQLSIQAIIDIIHLIIIDMGGQRPADNYEAVSLLFTKGVINEETAQRISTMIGLRNILVHEYGRIDRKKVYEVLAGRLNDLKEFQGQIQTHLQ